ncbi:MAG: FmdB family transcriptional regulator [Planctomycetes bacterium]|nr:FmdB family transcriptional regulator [Planctomycetota bacterium]
MPVYEYVVIHDDGSEGERFEILQSIHAKPLTQHPESGLPVQRIISQTAPPKIPGGTKQSKPDLSNQNLERLGFTKYQKTDSSSGKYEKVAGEGPDMIQRD